MTHTSPEHEATLLIASDVHGRIPMLLRAALEYQRVTGERVEAILVSGDLGVWPEDSRLDASTAKRSRTAPEELGFRAFRPRLGVRPTPRPDALDHLSKAQAALAVILAELEAPVLFVGGNHEDYVYLDACRSASEHLPVPVDEEARLRWIPHGTVVELATSAGPIRIAGLGGIAAEEDGRNPDRYHPLALVDEDAALALMEAGSAEYDILLTHDSARDFVHDGHGSSAIGALVEEARPTLHVCGHYHSRRDPRPYESKAEASRTLGVHVNTFLPDPETNRLRPNSLGIVRIRRDRVLSFAFADEAFLRRVSAKSWHRISS